MTFFKLIDADFNRTLLRTYSGGGSGGGTNGTICVEAEDMHLCRYKVEHNDKASGDAVIKLAGHTGYASTNFSGASGAYDLKLDFIDENDGKGQIDIFINGKFVTCIRLDEQTGDHTNGFRSVTLPGIEFDPGDVITLKGTKNCYEYARIDKISFTPVDVNEAPVAQDDSATTDEDAAVIISVLDNDSDADGDAIQVLDASGAANGDVTVNADGTITYTPDADFNGTDTFSYSISDGNGGTDTAVVSVTVNAINDDPIAVDDTATTTEEVPVVISVLDNDSDPDGDVLSFLTFISPENGSIAVNGDGTITYTPKKDFEGIDSFTYVVEDGNGGSDEATVTITVDGAEDADDDCLETTESAPVEGNLLDNDALPGEMSVVAIEGGAIGSTFDVTSADGRVGKVTVLADGTFRFDPDGGFEDLGAGETDSIELTYTVEGAAAGGSLAEKTIDFEGLDAGTVIQDQFDGVKITAMRKRDYDRVNDAMIFDSTNPTGHDYDLGHAPEQGNLLIISEDNDSHDPDDNARGGSIKVEFDNPVSVNSLTFVDIEEGARIYLYNDAGHRIGKIKVQSTENGGVRVQAINVDHVAKMKVVLYGSGAIDDLVYTDVADTVVTDTATVKVLVVGENDLPVAGDDPLGTDEDTPVSANVLLNDSDPDGDTLIVSAVDGGVVGVAFDVVSAGGNTGSVTVSEDGELVFDPGLGFQDLNDGDTDIVEVTYTVSDGAGGTDTATVRVEVDGATDNTAPVIVEPIVLFADENQTSAGALIGFDPDPGDVLTWAIVGGVDAGFFEIDPATGEVTFKEAPDFETPLDDGQDNRYDIQISLSDGIETVVQNVLVNVLDVDENVAPEGVADTIAGTEDAPFGANILDNDLDPEGGVLSVIEIAGGAVGTPFEIFTDGLRSVTVTIGADGEVVVDPDGRFEGLGEGDFDTVSIAYQLADDGGLTSESVATIVINGVNDAPEIGAPTEFTIPEGQADAGTIVAVDPEGDPIEYSIEGGVDADIFEIDPVTGALTFLFTPDFEQALDEDGDNVYEIIVGASDGSLIDNSDVQITVTEVNDPPSFTSFVDLVQGNPAAINISGGAGFAQVRQTELGVLGQVFAFDSNGDDLEFAISGGDDADFFQIDAATGEISIDALLPLNGSADGNSNFEVSLSVTDGNDTFDFLDVTYSIITAG